MDAMTRSTEPDQRRRTLEYIFAHFPKGQEAETRMLPDIPRAGGLVRSGRRWGVILAGGDGVRLRPLTKLICGDDRPKQFCPLFGGRTLLGQTLKRSERTIPREQLLVSLSGLHREWYSLEAGLRPSQRVVQPENKGTAPAILHSLLSLAQLDAQAIVAILPCDHHYSDEQLFASALECAFQTAAERADSVILLGAKPDYPEVEYGGIELGSPLGCKGRDLFRVRSFREKPAIDVARKLLDQGSVWNTFVMVGHVHAFLQMVQTALPGLLDVLASARMWIGEETHIERSLYQRIPSVNFSCRVLSANPECLAVLRLKNVGWIDLGDPGRAFLAACKSGSDPGWIQDWGRVRPVVSEAPERVPAVA